MYQFIAQDTFLEKHASRPKHLKAK